jgi:valyl-tRNA synthetase
MAHHLAQKDKGTGIAMVCTFGDVTDVVWWRELDLPTRPIIGKDGRWLQTPLPAWTTDSQKELFAELAGKTVFSAKQRIVEMLRESGDLVGEPEAMTHPVKFFEKGDKPLEVVTTRQWYIANGARDETSRAASHPRRRDRLPPRLHACSIQQLGGRSLWRLVDFPSAVLWSAHPRLVST